MPPARGSMVCFVNEGWVGTVVLFSMTAISPVFRQPNAATRRSFRPSPLKSAVSTSATLGHPSSQKAPNLPFASAAQPDDGALVVIGGEELAEVADEQILDAVLVDVGERDVRGVRDAGEVREHRTVPGRAAAEHQAKSHVGREECQLLVAAEMRPAERSKPRVTPACPAATIRGA